MNERIHDCLTDSLSWISRNFLSTSASRLKLTGDGRVSLDEREGLLDQTGFHDLAAIV